MNTKVILGGVAVLAVIGVGAVFLGRSSQPTSQPTQSESSTPAVVLTASGFAPQSVTVAVGTKVTWTNNSGATATVNSVNHPTHLAYSPLNLGSFGGGETLSLVFDRPGTYKYHNHLNASQTGVVVVDQ
ncbi:MAG: Blue (Type 1) copper domain protein [Candidatus Amesbacteria bacterium GW2011_GWA1_46_35]|uniref:Blue (Type 1) copper domain protein n=1 Tax=Candidatus Amesbacteria bacterium GW2011_GWC2_45_19 TaxID=1618366 RepID=A0A0G1M0E9_9BACT|nr:MAG: Blue (Type 1) copper domain protein [Candidatus Amesbacteria bacterium GW2011_GWC2_45_19]KKU36918.1 MAG: Blue (Type 1) copper domain protein [Candidatus Amesbacteria bacterium GW2011_GWA1_46_35]KKU68098.1 MAG: plastocyanin/azurin family copper binding protein [Microgenomates group bacterium GW2011_GWC1_47_20]